MIQFDNSYLEFSNQFYTPSVPAPASKPQLLAYNQPLGEEELGLGLNNLREDELADLFTGQVIPEGASSIALVYAGHQFGNFVPQLGDGRALLLGEVLSPTGQRFDIQLKGSGRTIYSRGGDGKSSLGPVLREYLVSEAMSALGIPTTRALAAVATGDQVQRETSLPGAVLARVASSHLRVGTFEYFSARREPEQLKQLLDYAIKRHYPQIADQPDPVVPFLEQVAYAQAKMVAHWMSVGFIHGVMNTDNMTISGETLDYGPCAFMDNFAADRVFSSIDRQGRYRYENQIEIAQWNLYRLASCLLPLVSDDTDQGVEILNQGLTKVLPVYEELYLQTMIKKFGLFSAATGDLQMIKDWLTYLETEDLDFTQSFRALSGEAYLFKRTAQFDAFYSLWQARLKGQPQSLEQAKGLMDSVNPVIIPRNHQVERAIQAGLVGDFSVFHQLNQALKQPFAVQPEFEEFQAPPEEAQRVTATFCGT